MKTLVILLPISLILSILEGCFSQPDSLPTGDNPKLNDNQERVIPMKNPVLLQGTDLLTFLRRLSVNQEYNLMLDFTSRKSIDIVGESRLLELYQRSDFGPEFYLKSIKYDEDSLVCFLKYESFVFGTKQFREVKCIIENDTAKLELYNANTIFCN
jgi:hypothetical protein